jgi:hypothetical protein
MLRITLDKIASSTKNARIEPSAFITEEIVPAEGYVIAVRILTDKTVYNTLENVHGRMMRLKPGDQIAGVLGSRRALFGYSGVVPKSLKVGDKINVLNLGGVLGQCTSFAPDVGIPFEAEVLGAVLYFPVLGERVGAQAHIGLNALPDTAVVESSAPIVAVVGTSMDAGKTVAACQIVRGFSRKGMKVAAGKVTGVALLRDILGMSDYGAEKVLSFNDAGLVSTNDNTAPDAARRIVQELNRIKPDVIVLELGDGILGEYGVRAVLSDKGLTRHFGAVVLCANDPVGAYGAVPILKTKFNLDAKIVTGPVTDNEVGCSFVRKNLGVEAANALTSPASLFDLVYKEVFPNGK